MTRFMVAITLLAALASTAHAQVQITISQPAEATTMDPGRSTQVLTVNYFYNLYDALTRWDNSLRLQPGLATSWKNVNETTWEFTLRQGVKFHDGAPLTDEGMKELARRPVGTGAYRFVEWVKDERLVMEANRDWWGWEGRAPAIDRVIWKPIPEDFPRIVALEKGEADVITNVPPDRIKGIADGRATQILVTPSSRIVTLSINSTQPPLADKRARQALHYALDIGSIIKNLYAGQGRPFSGGVADTDFGYNASLKPYSFDPAKAKQLLAEVGRPDGIDVSLHAGSGTMVNDKFLLEAIADMWAKSGIRAKIDIMEMGARQRMLNERTVPPNGLLLGNPQSTLLDADGSLWRLWHPNGFNGKYWAGSQPGQRFHDVMEQARYSLDPAKRRALYMEATQIIHDEKPWVELFQETIVYGVSRRVAFKPRADYRLIVAEMAPNR